MEYIEYRFVRLLEKHFSEIRFWSLLLFFTMLAMDMVCYSIYDHSVAVSLFWKNFLSGSNFGVILLNEMTPLITAMLFFILAGWSLFSRYEWLFLGIAGLGLALWLFFLGTPNVFSITGVARILLLPATCYFIIHEIIFGFQAYVKNNTKYSYIYITTFFWVSLAVASIIIMTEAMLRVNAVLFPLTYDIYLYKIDAAFFRGAQLAAQIGKEHVWVQKITFFIYKLIVFL